MTCSALHFFEESGVDCCCPCVSDTGSCDLLTDDCVDNPALDGAMRSKQVFTMRAINVTSEIPIVQLPLTSRDLWLTSVCCIAISCLMKASRLGIPSFTRWFKMSASRISAQANRYRFRSWMLADKIVPSSKAAFNRSLFLAVSGMSLFLQNDRLEAQSDQAPIQLWILSPVASHGLFGLSYFTYLITAKDALLRRIGAEIPVPDE